MRLIVADTSPLAYLILIGHIDILPKLFETVLVPHSVHAELSNRSAPTIVQRWAATLPPWIELRQVANAKDDALRFLGAGERDAILLALETHADLILIDERKGTKVAIDKGLDVAGTLGILRRGARYGLLNLADAFDRLKLTNFRYRQQIMDELLAEEKKRK
jgi:predicted nucleic acid-binding protein